MQHEHPQPQKFWGVPSSARTCHWARIISKLYLLPHRQNFALRCTCSGVDLPTATDVSECSASLCTHLLVTVQLKFTVELQAVQYSSTGPAAQAQQPCPGHLPAQARCRGCYQSIPRLSTGRWSAAQPAVTAESRKQLLTSTRVQCAARQVSPMASTGACWFTAKQQ